MRIFVDADGCPVRYETTKVALRHAVPVTFVANMPLQGMEHPLFDVQVVTGSFNAADDWIAEHAGPDDIVVTADVPLAERCLAAGATVLGHRGNRFSQNDIGEAMAMRELMNMLRQTGEVRGGPAPFTPRARSQYLSQLDNAVVAIQRRRAKRPPPAPPNAGSPDE